MADSKKEEKQVEDVSLKEQLSLPDIRDPLSDVTRKTRRAFLGFSTVGIIIHKTNFIPTKITTLGIEFSQADQSIIESILGLVALYFLITFTVYAISDLMSWRLMFAVTKKKVFDYWSKLKDDAKQARKEQKNFVEVPSLFGLGSSNYFYYDGNKCEFVPVESRWSFSIPDYRGFDDSKKMLIKLANSNRRWYKMSSTISWIRIFVEFIVPILVGSYASLLLLFYN